MTAKARVACGETRNVLKSLQPCSLKENRHVLHNILEKTKASQNDQQNRILGLIAVFDAIQCEHIGRDGKAYHNSFVRFDAAMELFFAYHNKGAPFVNTDKDKFLYALLHEKWGLCIYVVFVEHLNHRLIVLRPRLVQHKDFPGYDINTGRRYDVREHSETIRGKRERNTGHC